MDDWSEDVYPYCVSLRSYRDPASFGVGIHVKHSGRCYAEAVEIDANQRTPLKLDVQIRAAQQEPQYGAGFEILRLDTVASSLLGAVSQDRR